LTIPASQNESVPLLARLDAARIGVVLLLLLPAVAIFRGGLADPDLWLHLQAGRWIAEHGRVPWEDPFSYTAGGHRWIAYSWLPEIVFYRVTQGFGFAALILLTAGFGSLLLGLLYRACRAGGAARNESLAVAAFAGAATSGAWTERPQLLSFVLLATLVWWLRSPRIRPHLWWAAPFLMVVWANVHLLFAVGIGLLALDAACAWFDVRRVAAVFTSALAALVNPYGASLFTHLGTMSEQRVAAAAVVELQSPDFTSPLGAVMGAFLLLSILAFATRSGRLTRFELASYLIALAGGLSTARAMAIFAIVAAPTVARHLRLPERAPPAPRRVPVPLLCVHYAIVGSALVMTLAFAPRAAGWREHLVPGAFPVAAAACSVTSCPTKAPTTWPGASSRSTAWLPTRRIGPG